MRSLAVWNKTILDYNVDSLVDSHSYYCLFICLGVKDPFHGLVKMLQGEGMRLRAGIVVGKRGSVPQAAAILVSGILLVNRQGHRNSPQDFRRLRDSAIV